MTTVVQLAFSGLAQGCLYALVALSFAVVMKATGRFHLIQGTFVLYGAYLTYNAHVTWGLPFVLAVLLAAAVCAGAGVAGQRYVFSRVTAARRGEAGVFAVLLIGIAVLIIGQALAVSVWGSLTLRLGDPWGLATLRVAGVALTERDLWVIGLSLVLLAAFWWLVQRTRIGVAMRATASDAEAARAQGINPDRVAALAWACSAVAAVFAGVMLATEVGGGTVPSLGQVAFAALPALILGGVDSLAGCVLGGVALGLVQTYAAGYAPASWGQGFNSTLPWIVLIAVLLIKPSGLLGSRSLRRA